MNSTIRFIVLYFKMSLRLGDMEMGMDLGGITREESEKNIIKADCIKFSKIIVFYKRVILQKLSI